MGVRSYFLFPSELFALARGAKLSALSRPQGMWAERRLLVDFFRKMPSVELRRVVRDACCTKVLKYSVIDRGRPWKAVAIEDRKVYVFKPYAVVSYAGKEALAEDRIVGKGVYEVGRYASETSDVWVLRGLVTLIAHRTGQCVVERHGALTLRKLIKDPTKPPRGWERCHENEVACWFKIKHTPRELKALAEARRQKAEERRKQEAAWALESRRLREEEMRDRALLAAIKKLGLDKQLLEEV